jgi:hypothetical protein
MSYLRFLVVVGIVAVAAWISHSVSSDIEPTQTTGTGAPPAVWLLIAATLVLAWTFISPKLPPFSVWVAAVFVGLVSLVVILAGSTVEHPTNEGARALMDRVPGGHALVDIIG